MKLLLRALKRHGFGTRALTEEDFWHICEKEQITVEFWDERISFYMSVPEIGLKAIVLPRRKRGLKLLFAMFHELGHHFLHGGNEVKVAFECGQPTKEEAEADFAAVMAVAPKVGSIELGEPSRFGQKLLKDRERIHFLYDV